MYFDGASNMLGRGIGTVLISPQGKYIPITARLNFDCTNNMAEYEACALGIQAAINNGILKLKVFGDSALVIYQLRGEWEVRNPKLIPYVEHIKDLIHLLQSVIFEYIPREENQFADALATLSSMFALDSEHEMPLINIRRHDKQAFCLLIDETVDDHPWFHDIKQYLTKGEYPDAANDNDKKHIRRRAMGFLLVGETLYKKNYDSVLLRCIDQVEAQNMIKEVHEGVFGTHIPGPAMAKKILRAGYYWSTMERDCYQYVRKCHKCQAYADNSNVPPTALIVLASPWPFAMWGMDVIGPIEPKASNGHRFILVAIDYFTKWVEATSYAHVTRKVVTSFIKKNIICRYGIPDKIITDNGSNLNNKMVEELCQEFKIQHHNSSPYRPKMNGAVEAANKNIKKIVQKMVVSFKDWHEMLPFALHDDAWTMYFDGASNMLGRGIGTVLISPQGKYIPITARLNFDCTNNMAEYEACALGIQPAINNGILKLKVFGDSALVIYQLREALLQKGKTQKNQYPFPKRNSVFDHRPNVKIIRLTEEAKPAMAKKILRAGYYWSTMERDCYQYVRKCHKCQAYADNIHVPPTALNVLASPWPFAMWGMDVIGPIEPKASNGHRFILVAIDYFTKWVEAASYAHVTRKVA
ncbi:uncharacterized protein LOC109792591 [Cajanus cajan]|uniref:uncharacterized protein LOC109792591 n=1 Tax=Cajanus cajan TaxID=3821 RepID=UPI00098DB342|nr:uncharacterized protein LOC109792591 [Cajanus cajan]